MMNPNERAAHKKADVKILSIDILAHAIHLNSLEWYTLLFHL